MDTIAFNAQTLPQSLSGTNGYITSASYNASDQITNLAFQSGTTTNYTYDPNMLRLTALVTSGNIQNLGYTYDNVGNVKTITDNLTAQTTTFTYDDLNRLLTAGIPSVYSHAWTYNPIGNMLTRNDNNGNVTYAYADAAHKHAVTQIGSQYFCYDANGNMTRRNATSSACTNGDVLSYDAENRLTSIVVGGTTTTFTYDGDGNRVKKVAGGTTTFYVGKHYEVTNGNALKYYYFGKQRVAMRVGTNPVTYLHSDHLGSASATSGASVSSQNYYAFGNIRNTTGSVPTDFGFTGQRRDASAGLMFYNVRYYDATLGRFVSADTIVPQAGNPQSLNRYAYVLNNPLKYTDPSGHCWGAASGARSLPTYDVTCGNLDMALTIVQHPNASAVEKLGAGAYLGAEGFFHGAAVVGTGIIAWEALVPTLTAGGTGAAMAEGACADGDCTNEANAAIQATQSAAQQIQSAAQQIQSASQPVLGLSQRMINALTRVSTQNPNSREVVLGRFEDGNGYTWWGQFFDRTYLNMPDYLWKEFQKFPGDFRLINQQFPINQMNAGKEFILSTPYDVAKLNKTTDLWWEIQFLLQQGYTLVANDGTGIDRLVAR